VKTALDLRNIFMAHVNKIGKDITLSMGVAVFDRQRPLGGAIQLSRQGLRKSKEMKGKNALTIAIQTASGNEFFVSSQWGTSWVRIQNAIELINGTNPNAMLSMGWTYEVEAFLQSLPNRWGEPEFRKAVEDEVKRITFRKLKIFSAETSEKRMRRKKNIWETLLCGRDWFNITMINQPVEAISNQLHLIAFLCRESTYQTENFSERMGEEAA
jgi:hypothetical protein